MVKTVQIYCFFFLQFGNSPREKKDNFVCKPHHSFIYIYPINIYCVSAICKELTDTVCPHRPYRLLKETVIKQAYTTVIGITKSTVNCGI